MRARVPLPTPRAADINASIGACLANAERLLDDALHLEFRKLGSTRLMVSILAQEECAKAFLLFLVGEQIIPWTSDLLRVMRNHACKHLVAIVIEYLDTREAAQEEYERAERYQRFVSSLVQDERRDSDQFRKLRESLKIVYWQRFKPIEPPQDLASSTGRHPSQRWQSNMSAGD